MEWQRQQNLKWVVCIYMRLFTLDDNDKDNRKQLDINGCVPKRRHENNVFAVHCERALPQAWKTFSLDLNFRFIQIAVLWVKKCLFYCKLEPWRGAYSYSVQIAYQWRTQDMRGRRQPQRGTNLLWPHFCQKLHKNGKKSDCWGC